MAKNTQTKTIFKRFIAVALAVIFAGGIAAGVCCMGFASRSAEGKWFGNFKDLSTWHWTDKADGNQPENPDDNKPNDNKPSEASGDGLLVSDGENNGVRLTRARIAPADYADYGISTQAESAYTLTAYVYPSAADDQRVEWTVEDLSGTLNAAEYIALNANGLSATVACLKDFDHQFTVTVKSLENPEAKATCTLDYVERVIDIELLHGDLDSATLPVEVDYESSKYTIKANENIVLSNFQVTSDFKQEFDQCGRFDEGIDYVWLYPDYESQFITYTSDSIDFKKISEVDGVWNVEPQISNTLMDCFLYATQRGVDNHILGEYVQTFREAASRAKSCFIFDVTVTLTYGGKIYSTKTSTYDVRIDTNVIHVAVDKVNISNGSLIF